MPDDSSSSSSSSSSSDSSSETQTHSVFNRAQLADLKLAENIVLSARIEPYRIVLATRTITDTVINHLAGLCQKARKVTAKVFHEGIAGEEHTQDDTDEDRELIVLIQEFQASAKQKYARRNPGRLQGYFIGQRLTGNASMLHQIAFSISELVTPKTGTDLAAATDTLPGMTLEKVNKLRAFIGLPEAGAEEPESSSSSSSEGGDGLVDPDTVADVVERDAMIKEINDRRMEVQFAADAAWPYTTPTNIEARRAFHLPRNRPFSG
jgi:hypothetical protein